MSQREVIKALLDACEPFEGFAERNTSGADVWVSNTHRERISDWFGPSEFRALFRAAAAVRALGEEKGEIKPPPDFDERSDGAMRRSFDTVYKAAQSPTPHGGEGGEPIDFCDLADAPTLNPRWQPDLQELVYSAISYVRGDYEDADENNGEQTAERLLIALRSALFPQKAQEP